MLDFIYYPVSWVMSAWHWLFAHLLPDTPNGSGIAWALSVACLVFTVRAVLYKPFVAQVRTTKKMQELNPQIQTLRKKYANDRVRMTEEMQKLQKEHGFSPILGCLPLLLQVPLFIGLFHVLHSFNRTRTRLGGTGMSVVETRNTGNYAFSAEQVQNFLDARLFGVPLSAYVTEPTAQFAAFVEPGEAIDFTRAQIITVATILMILAAIATHLNSRAAVARQNSAAMDDPQTRVMNRLALYVFPLGIIVTGVFLPIAILLYWLSNNIWTFGQQRRVFGQMAVDDAAAHRIRRATRRQAVVSTPGLPPLPQNFDPAAAMDRGYAALPGNPATAHREFLDAYRYSARQHDWQYRGDSGLAQAAHEIGQLVSPDVRGPLIAAAVTPARRDAESPVAGIETLNRYLNLRAWQIEHWLSEKKHRWVVDDPVSDRAILRAFEAACARQSAIVYWGEGALTLVPLPASGDAMVFPRILAPYPRAYRASQIALAHHRLNRHDQARGHAREAADLFSEMSQSLATAHEKGFATTSDGAVTRFHNWEWQHAVSNLIASMPADTWWDRLTLPQRERVRRRAEAQESIRSLSVAVRHAKSDLGADHRTTQNLIEKLRQAEHWHDSVAAALAKRFLRAQAFELLQEQAQETTLSLIALPDDVHEAIDDAGRMQPVNTRAQIDLHTRTDGHSSPQRSPDRNVSPPVPRPAFRPEKVKRPPQH
ncbi:hypothetical protein GOHSU_16_01180 [Gordonia hirsuta DSM 44140 = NBRC 16056]|uniref:Membrane protein insertase YidC n=1 Tax=Gordonia hirsuta DSM 44140 = NBRC 16056 TaxID=1121927 RepID=L7L7M8_9ACTN|nr:hypothetical protein GOHSU_16_01180 [Gordonia hirsuta DSM 44140 = NBRC 16056]